MFFDTLATFVQTVGALTSSNAAATASGYSKQIDLYNATVTQQQGQIAEDQQRRQSEQVIGQEKANAGASGAAGGSAADVIMQSAFNSEMDALNTKYNYDTKATALEMDAKLAGQRAQSQRTGGYLTAAGILVGGAGKSYANNPDSVGVSPFRIGS